MPDWRSTIARRAIGPPIKHSHRCRFTRSRFAVAQPVCPSSKPHSASMNQIAFDRSTSRIIACSDVSSWAQGEPILGRQDKSADCRRAGCGCESGGFAASRKAACRRFFQNPKDISVSRDAGLCELTVKPS
jgi:hypothetical protein